MSVNELTKGTRFLGETLKYIFQRKGLLSLSAAHIAVFCKSRPELSSPDIQFHILPATMDVQKLMEQQVMELENQPGLTIAPCQVRPESRGTIRIKSSNPSEYPSIQPNYLSDPIDQAVAVASPTRRPGGIGSDRSAPLLITPKNAGLATANRPSDR